jgi:hypothetical protein
MVKDTGNDGNSGNATGLSPIVLNAVTTIAAHVDTSFWQQLARNVSAGDAFKCGEPRAGIYSADNIETMSLVYGGKANNTP